MSITPVQRLENLEFEAHINGKTQDLLPTGLLTIEAGPKSATDIKDKMFVYFWQSGLGEARERIDRPTAAGLMGWKWTTPLETI